MPIIRYICPIKYHNQVDRYDGQSVKRAYHCNGTPRSGACHWLHRADVRGIVYGESHRETGLPGCRPDKIEALLSPNILKNAMGVGIPGTGMLGLPIAIALGAIIGKSDYQLEVLKDLTPETLEAGKQYIAENRITIKQKEGISEKLYVEIICTSGDKQASAVIAGGHTRFVEESLTPTSLTPNPSPKGEGNGYQGDEVPLNLRLFHHGGAYL